MPWLDYHHGTTKPEKNIKMKWWAVICINNSSDLLGDGTVGLDEYRSDCVKRMAYKSIKDLDAAYEKLLSVSIYK